VWLTAPLTVGTLAALGFAVACGSRTGLVVFESPDASREQAAPLPDVFAEPPAARDGASDVPNLDPDVADAPYDASAFHPCTDGGKDFIYLVGDPEDASYYARDTLYTFDPDSYVMTNVGPLTCPDYDLHSPHSSTPYALAIDRAGVAYVDSFLNGALYRIDGRTGACASTAYDPKTQGGAPYAMSFVAGEDGGERLYVATWPYAGGELSTLDTTTFAVAPLAKLDSYLFAFTGTGDGRLFAFSPATTSTSAHLYELRPPSASFLHEYPLRDAGVDTTIAFWEGSVFLFSIGGTSSEVDRYDLVTQTRSRVATLDVGIYAATTLTCAPP
jgi:hypothetical protein